jgi:hypothetical protein
LSPHSFCSAPVPQGSTTRRPNGAGARQSDERDWNEALRRYGPAGLSQEFLGGVATFIRSGCQSNAKVCPRTAKDRELVDVLAIRVVNEGMSTTFLPFDCPPSP